MKEKTNFDVYVTEQLFVVRDLDHNSKNVVCYAFLYEGSHTGSETIEFYSIIDKQDHSLMVTT